MTEHVSTSRMERFCLSGLPEADLAEITEHLTQCQPCHELFADTLKTQRGASPIRFTLEPEFWLKDEHVDFDQLVAIADNKLDKTDREIIDIHLSTCSTCREDVRSFLAVRKEIEPELRVRYGPGTQSPPRSPVRQWNWWQAIVRRPVYANAVLILIAVALAMAVMIFRNRTSVFEAWKSSTPQTSPKPSPRADGAETTASPTTTQPNNESASNSPKPTMEPSPKKTTDNPAPRIGNPEVVVLNDAGGTISVSKDGSIVGLDDVPRETKRDIATALVAEKIETPAVLNNLTPEGTTLRGSGNKGAPFRLLSPGGTVTIENDPVFKWEQLAGASAYRVYVLDSRGHQVAKSEDLSSAMTYWKPSAPINRGNIYSWVVIAVVDSKEIVSPGAAAPAMKFQVLSASDLQKLSELTATRSHLALGVFYAKVGLLAEAEREFQELIRSNPDNNVVKKLLRSVRSMRGAPQ